MTLPKIGTTGAEHRGLSIVEELVYRPQADGGLGDIFRRQPEADKGIDGHLEVVDQLTGEVTGKFLGVQIKAGPSFFRHHVDGAWTVYIAKSTVHYWRQYAVPVILTLVDVDARVAYWQVVSTGVFDETEDAYKIPVPDSQQLGAGAADALARLAAEPPAALATQLRELTAQLSEATAAAFEQHRAAWREGRRAEARTWLDAIAGTPARLAGLTPAVAAGVLRFAASVALEADEGGAEPARAWADDARRLDPTADDAPLRAALLVHDSDLPAALALLAGAPSPRAQLMRAALLLREGEVDEARRVLDASAAAAADGTDAAELWRVRSHERLAARDPAGAAKAIAHARALLPRNLLVRLSAACVAYYGGFAPACVPVPVPPWPRPPQDVCVRRDADAVRGFTEAADGYRELLTLDLLAHERRVVETWQVAALSAVPSRQSEALTLLKERLARDPGHPYLVLWAATEHAELDLTFHLAALADEVERTSRVSLASVYLAACLAAERVTGLGDWLAAWRERFAAAGALPTWTFARARAFLRAGAHDHAASLLSDVGPESAEGLRAELLAHEAEHCADHADEAARAALVGHLEAAARRTGDPQFLYEACRLQADAGAWHYVREHVDRVLERLPTPPVRRLAIFARYFTNDPAGTAELADAALAHADGGLDTLELLRLRADARFHLGQLSGALADVRRVLAAQPVATSEEGPATQDLLFLARLHAAMGDTHELATTARQLTSRPELPAAEALALANALTHDDPPLAVACWVAARARGFTDDQLGFAITLGFRLGLDADLSELLARLAALAASGSPVARRYTIDELLDARRDWAGQRERLLEEYARGETATHIVAEFLNEPLAQLYHVVAATNARQPVLRHGFALQLRDGGRGVPRTGSTLAKRGRLALDLSALLLAHHLELLPVLERHHAPLQLPHGVMAALRAERDKFTSHQPSQVEQNRRLLAAEHRGWLRPWSGPLPDLEPDDREAAGNWARWLALLERALREGAFVLDLPLGENVPYGRPAAVAGPARLGRLITVARLHAELRAVGALDESALDARSDADEGEVEYGGDTLPPGAVLYLTDAGAGQLAAAGLLAAASERFVLWVDPNDQQVRRARLDAQPEWEERAAWVSTLIRRVSDGLGDGRYALLPPAPPRRRIAGSAPGEGEQGDGSGDPPPLGAPDASLETGAESPDGMSHASAPDASAGEEAGAAGDPGLASRLLLDLLALPNGTVDAVWIDDRAINRYAFAGTARVTDVVEVLAALHAAGHLTDAQRWTLTLRLRAANVRWIPLSAEEVAYHVAAAPVTDGAVVETRALRVLRQSVAAFVTDVGTLRLPPPERLAAGTVADGNYGELDLVRSYSSAIQHALIQLWRAAARPGAHGAAAQARAEAQSFWVVRNLYLDLGLLRARVVQPEAPPSPDVSAVDAGALMMGALQLLAASGSLVGGPGDALAAAYTDWIDRHVAARRATSDDAFRVALGGYLRHLLADWPGRDAPDRTQRLVARLFAGRLYDALPETWRAEVARDAALMAVLRRAVVSSLTIGRWHVAPDAFAHAATAALAGQSATVPVLGSTPAPAAAGTTGDAEGDSGGELTLSATVNSSRESGGADVGGMLVDEAGNSANAAVAEVGFTFTSADGRESVTVEDAVFSVLAAGEPARRAACRQLRAVVDMSTDAWRSLADVIAAESEPAARLVAVLEHRQAALRHRYAATTTRWRAEHRISADDLRAPELDATLRHLRLLTPDTTPRDPNRHTTAEKPDEYVSERVWAAAAETLIAEDGIQVALERLAGLPVPLPGPVWAHLASMPADERRSVMRRRLRRRTSPVSALQTLRLLAVLGRSEPQYRRWMRRAAARFAGADWETDVRLLQLVLAEARASVRVEDLSDGVNDDTDGSRASREALTSHSPAGRLGPVLLASWYHAHRFVERVRREGIDPVPLVQWLEGRPEAQTRELFAAAQPDRQDVAHPVHLAPARLLAAGLQYAAAGTDAFFDSEVEELGVRAWMTTALAGATSSVSPKAELLRDLSRCTNVLRTWLPLHRNEGGAVFVGATVVVPATFSPGAVREHGLDAIRDQPAGLDGWAALALVNGDEPLAGADAARLDAAIASVDLGTLLGAGGTQARVVAVRLARQAVAVGDAERRASLRQALIALGRDESSPPRPVHRTADLTPGGEPSEPSVPGEPPRREDRLTDRQLAVLEALYLLAQGEGDAIRAMTAFAADLAVLGKADAAYLRRARGVLESLVAERSLAEAHALTALLAEARAS